MCSSRGSPLFEAHADGFIPARSPRALLSRDFFGKRLIHGTPTVSLDVAEQSCRAVPLVVPARIVSYRVEADPFNRNAGLPRLRHLMPDDPEPGRPHIAFDAGLSEEHRPAVTIVDVSKKLAQRAVIGMVHRYRQIAVDPLVMQVIVDADNVDVVRPAP